MTAIRTMLSYNRKNDYEVAFLISKIFLILNAKVLFLVTLF